MKKVEFEAMVERYGMTEICNNQIEMVVEAYRCESENEIPEFDAMLTDINEPYDEKKVNVYREYGVTGEAIYTVYPPKSFL